LRSGLAETLALLGSFPASLTSVTAGAADATAVLTVRAILDNADWKQWAGLNDVLPLLAEAAPGAFLDAVERALGSSPCPFDEVFAQERDGLVGRTYMTGILWALETLAWDATHLGRVVLVLGELAGRDPGGKWANRPINSLTTIFLPWLPQTCASPPARVAAVASIVEEMPVAGWKLLESLLPEVRSTSSYTRRPAWRPIIPDDWSARVSPQEYSDQVARYWTMAIKAARGGAARLAELTQHVSNLSATSQDEFIAYMESAEVAALADSDRATVWEGLAELVARHRKFSEARWAMRPERVDKFDRLARQLEPANPKLRYRRLFNERESDLYEKPGNFEEQRSALEIRRRDAISEVAKDRGSEGALEFASTVDSPWRVGFAYGGLGLATADREILPAQLGAGDKARAQFAGGFVWSRFRAGGWDWVDRLDTAGWSTDQIGEFLSLLPFSAEAWQRAALLLGDTEATYWKRTSANPYESDGSLDLAIDKLILHGRPEAALRCVANGLHKNHRLDVGRASRALLAALEADKASSLDTYEVVEIIGKLQKSADADRDELFRIEWAYLPLLVPENNASPSLLQQRLATDPRFFCEAIRLVFRSRNDNGSEVQLTDDQSRIARNAYRLLDDWRILPGLEPDGTFDGIALSKWLRSVEEECRATGHREIALTIVGHVFVHAPPDPDGLWIHRTVAEALNSRDVQDMREGFRTGLYNTRGVHSVDPTGSGEQALADHYRRRAEAVEAAGYPRVATILRELATSYDREAKVVSSRFEHE
jgi:hypothetical protein